MPTLFPVANAILYLILMQSILVLVFALFCVVLLGFMSFACLGSVLGFSSFWILSFSMSASMVVSVSAGSGFPNSHGRSLILSAFECVSLSSISVSVRSLAIFSFGHG